MRMSRIAAAAGLFIAALGLGGAADARHYDARDGRHYGWNDHHRGRGYYGPRGYDRPRGYAYRHHPCCWTEWRHHHRIRVCR